MVSEFKCVGDVSNCNAHRDLEHETNINKWNGVNEKEGGGRKKTDLHVLSF